MPERSNYGYVASDVVAVIVIINGLMLWIPPESLAGQILQKIHDFVLFEDY